MQAMLFLMTKIDWANLIFPLIYLLRWSSEALAAQQNKPRMHRIFESNCYDSHRPTCLHMEGANRFRSLFGLTLSKTSRSIWDITHVCPVHYAIFSEISFLRWFTARYRWCISVAMYLIPELLVFASLALQATAHGAVTEYVIDGKSYPG